MAAVTLLAPALRGTTVSPSLTVPAGAPGYVRLSLVSPTFATDPAAVWDLLIEQSVDAGATWHTLATSSNVGGFGLAVQNVWFDGTARLVRATATVPVPFNWGLTGERL